MAAQPPSTNCLLRCGRLGRRRPSRIIIPGRRHARVPAVTRNQAFQPGDPIGQLLIRPGQLFHLDDQSLREPDQLLQAKHPPITTRRSHPATHRHTVKTGPAHRSRTATHDYGPQPEIHDADCPDAPAGLPRLRVSAAQAVYPYARHHSCFPPETVTQNAQVAAEHLPAVRRSSAGRNAGPSAASAAGHIKADA